MENHGSSMLLVLGALAPHDSTASAVRSGVALVAIAAAVGVCTKFIRVPYTVALVIAGLLLALLSPGVTSVQLTEEMVLTLFLPPLLFQAGLNLELSELRKHWVTIALFAFPGVILSAGAAALAIRFLLPLAVPAEYANWTTALVLGVMVAPTDPISVVAVFRQFGVPQRLRVLIEGESLFNDGTAAAFFTVLKGGLVVTVVSGVAASLPGPGEVAIEFFRVTGIGLLVGLVLGAATFWILKHLNDHTLETGITVALAWGSFVAAEYFHGSGVMSVLVAALLIGNFGKSLAMKEETRITLTGFWDGVDFIVNSVVFLLVGLEIGAPEIGGWRHLTQPVVFGGAAAVFATLLLSRAALVGLAARVQRQPWRRGWGSVIWWAGLRGGLSVALALGLPPGDARSYLLSVVFLVVLATLLVQATTMQFFIRRAEMSDEDQLHLEHDPAKRG
ncbi:MAG: sodium:proton antiporter [Phycisphaeraceae bacterium]|nr:sodium:proton antiporter [Phycisphaeraceae bacterium]